MGITPLSTKALNFTPTEEEQALIEKASLQDRQAENALADHLILFQSYGKKPKGWVKVKDLDSQELAAPINEE